MDTGRRAAAEKGSVIFDHPEPCSDPSWEFSETPSRSSFQPSFLHEPAPAAGLFPAGAPHWENNYSSLCIWWGSEEPAPPCSPLQEAEALVSPQQNGSSPPFHIYTLQTPAATPKAQSVGSLEGCSKNRSSARCLQTHPGSTKPSSRMAALCQVPILAATQGAAERASPSAQKPLHHFLPAGVFSEVPLLSAKKINPPWHHPRD